MKNGPLHILDAKEYEPIYTPQVNIFEECLRREAERVAHRENLMNRVVFDCGDPTANLLSVLNQTEETKLTDKKEAASSQPEPNAQNSKETLTKEQLEE